MRIYAVALLLLTQAVLPGAVAAADDEQTRALTTPNEPPLAEAGLDQRVPHGRTVLLDGRGSRDPDGNITGFEWTVTRPDGSLVTPDCPTCPRTTFTPNETGTYQVELTVSDDDGASTSDSLFVEVTVGNGPTVSLSGPTTTTAGATTEFVADAQAGSAELDRIEWRVDGTVVATRDLDGATENATLEGTFPSSGAYTVSARVFDASNRSDSDTRPISVTGTAPPGNGTTPNGSVPVLPGPGNPGGPSSPGGPGAPGAPGNGGGNASTLAEQYDPVVRGPQVVTGSRPLSASYRLGNSPSAAALQQVVWFRGSGRFDSGDSTRVDWSPGDHRLFALVDYTDGSTDVVSFPNGRTTVVADPQPSLALSELDADGRVSGSFTAGDNYGNLVDVVVEIDGQTVYERHASRAGSRPTLGSRVESEFALADVEPNSTHEVVVRATDGRGQTATLRRDAASSGEIEVVRAEFVNTPVDSYHERLDPDRYTAHHVIEVRLNGNSPDDLQTYYSGTTGVDMISNDSSNRELIQRSGEDVLVIHSFWTSETPRDYTITYLIENDSPSSESLVGNSQFTVEPSDPVLVLTTLTDGTEPEVNDWGVVVDATQSFDPDHTRLRFDWSGGANPTPGNPMIGEFDRMGMGELEVRDGNDGFSAQRCCFMQFFVPQIESVEQLNEGPFNATDIVQFEISSDNWGFTKSSGGYYDVDLSYESESRYVTVLSNDETPLEYRTEEQGDEQRQYSQRTIVEVQAAALSEDTVQPTVALYNDAHPDRVRTNVTLPTVEVRNQTTTEQFRDNITVESLAYEVRRENGTKHQVVTDQSELQVYIREGYQIVSETRRTTGVLLERRIEREEEHTSRISFGTEEDRAEYLRENANARSAGSRAVTQTQTEYVWRDSRGGPGTYTDQTRMRTIPAQTRTLTQYETEVRHTQTETEMVRTPYEHTVRRTSERPVTRCNQMVGCYEVTVTETVTDTVTDYRMVPTPVEETWWTTSTYWSTVPQSPGDSPTGRTKQVVVSESRQVQEYRFAVESQGQVTRETFFATQTQSETVEEWETYQTVQNEVIAQKFAKRDDIRVGNVEQELTWTVATRGETTEVVSEYEDPTNVVETIAIVTGEVREREFNPITAETEVVTVDTFREEVIRDGVVSTYYLIRSVSSQESNCLTGDYCED
ncbi:PKD domain-containing protein [Haloarchaeobius litoreus]|uniref:PKD domain-containing protein n=1 Tax=Haloarchaeobius litoreus TaxID=755306 RepID=A0ABD6DFU0_9EURY|nr:PKD domain-containing protein [Haloarchaeobius litoreus]